MVIFAPTTKFWISKRHQTSICCALPDLANPLIAIASEPINQGLVLCSTPLRQADIEMTGKISLQNGSPSRLPTLMHTDSNQQADSRPLEMGTSRSNQLGKEEVEKLHKLIDSWRGTKR